MLDKYIKKWKDLIYHNTCSRVSHDNDFYEFLHVVYENYNVFLVNYIRNMQVFSLVSGELLGLIN